MYRTSHYRSSCSNTHFSSSRCYPSNDPPPFSYSSSSSYFSSSDYSHFSSSFDPSAWYSSSSVYFSAQKAASCPLLSAGPSFSRPHSYFSSANSPYRSKGSEISLFSSPLPEYHFDPQLFLRPGNCGRFVGDAEEIRPFVEEAFEKVLGRTFPADLRLQLLSKDRFVRSFPYPGAVGISFNRKEQGLLSDIFVVSGAIGDVMLTVGHEIGHVLTETLADPLEEEAKAYAFSLLWMEAIRKNNIAGLGEAVITHAPAENGLHDRAFDKVMRSLKENSAWEAYLSLCRKGGRRETFSC